MERESQLNVKHKGAHISPLIDKIEGETVYIRPNVRKKEYFILHDAIITALEEHSG